MSESESEETLGSEDTFSDDDDERTERRGGGDRDQPAVNERDIQRAGHPNAQSKHWCFTLNNYSPNDVWNELPEGMVYCIVGREVGESGTRHLQGFVSFATRKRLSACRRIFRDRAHWEVARHVPAAIQYCKKENNFVEFGRPPRGQGARTDLDSFKNAVRNGNRDHKKLREEFSSVYAKYSRFAHDYVSDNVPKHELREYPLRTWQSALYGILQRPPCDRKIHFIVDPTGNSGKSWFAQYVRKYKEHAQVMQPGRRADMAYALETESRIVFIDCPRSKQGEYIQYDFLEQLKDGYVFSPKYESRCIDLKKMHVVVLMNENPDMEKLSRDRYLIWVIDGNGSDYVDESPRY